jgi:diguanylate cyclase (GGDEF)-like protein/PAS domain S-box-containing protein
MTADQPAPAGRGQPAAAAAPQPTAGAQPTAAADTARRAAFADAWLAAIGGTSHVVLSTVQIRTLLRELTGLLADALAAERFTATAGYDSGRRLAEAGFTEPDSLACTVSLLGEGGLEPTGRSVPDARSRLSELQGSIAAGHTAALRDRILTAQEALIRAALIARNRAQSLLHATETRFRTVFAGSAVGISISALDGTILDANQALLDMLSHPLEELRKRSIADFVHPDDAGDVAAAYAALVDGERDHFQADKPICRGDGTVLWTHVTMSLIPEEPEGSGCVVTMFEDVTDRHLLETRLRYLATHDPLTQLPNRALLLESLDRLFADSGDSARLGLCFVDLDGFKVVNDCFGHAVGDRLLVEVAGRLDKSVSTGGHLVARMGGDEFVILVAHSTGPTQVIEVAERVLDALVPSMWIDDHELSVSASIGIVERRMAGTDPADMLRAADATLYRAKADGKGRWALFDPLRNAYEMARYALSTTMPAALAGGEFFVDYQPIVRLTDGILAGVDAQPRWRHPRQGLLGPDRFIGLAGETGLTATFTRWLLLTACQQALRWQEAHPGVTLFVSVGLTSSQSEDPRLVDDVLHVLNRTGLDPRRLQLELNRSADREITDEPSAAVRALSARGVRIALADFGLSHGNLAQLRSLPAHTLKIGAPFVQGLSAPYADPSDHQIVTAIVSLAHGLDLTVTAAGVETATQAARLHDIGCDAGQGSFLGQPGPPEQVGRLLAMARHGSSQASVLPSSALDDPLDMFEPSENGRED